MIRLLHDKERELITINLVDPHCLWHYLHHKSSIVGMKSQLSRPKETVFWWNEANIFVHVWWSQPWVNETFAVTDVGFMGRCIKIPKKKKSRNFVLFQVKSWHFKIFVLNSVQLRTFLWLLIESHTWESSFNVAIRRKTLENNGDLNDYSVDHD